VRSGRAAIYAAARLKTVAMCVQSNGNRAQVSAHPRLNCYC
jgi:hypothetical protein